MPERSSCQNHQVARVNLARNHENWNDEAWSQVLFTNESRFCLKPDDGTIKVWRCLEKEAMAEAQLWYGEVFISGHVLRVIENGSLIAPPYEVRFFKKL